MIDGVVLGALSTEHVYDMNLCIKDLNPLIIDVAQAIAQIKEGSYQSIADGIYTVGQSVSQVGIIMRECPNATREEDLEKLKEMGDTFLHPLHLIKSIPKHLFFSGVDIYHSVRDGMKDAKAEEYEAAGKAYGKAAALLIWGKPSRSQVFFDNLLQWECQYQTNVSILPLLISLLTKYQTFINKR